MVKILESFDEAKYLSDEATIQAYLAFSLASGDKAEFIEALNTVASAKRMVQLKTFTGVIRQRTHFCVLTSSQN